METRTDYEKWPPGDFSSQCQIAVFLLLLVIVTVLVIYGGLSQGAIMRLYELINLDILLGFVPLLMSGMKKKKEKERHRRSFIRKIKPSEEKFEMQSSADETRICVVDLTLANVKERRRKKISYSRVFSLFRRKKEPTKDIFTISGDICEMEDIEDGRSSKGKGKKANKNKEKDPFSSLDQILLSLLNMGMMRKV